MKFFRDLKTDYLESRFSAYESFAEWFLKRKLGFWGSGKELDWSKRVRLPTPAQLIRSDLECETRTKLPINHCAEMLTRTLRSETGLFAPSPIYSGSSGYFSLATLTTSSFSFMALFCYH
ncbi:TPA: hypothetical protein ACGO4G_000747 [Streptococcus suis]